MTLTLLTVLPFAGALLAAFLPSNARNAEAWLAGLVAVACTALVASQAPEVMAGGVIRESWAWAPQLGLSVSLRMDGFAWLFALLVSLMGALVVLYARYYLSPDDPAPRFFAFLLAFMGAMLGIVLSGNLVQLVVFWELTSLTSFMLIGYWYHRPEARRGARMAMMVTVAGGLCLLAGVVMLGGIAGSYELDVVLAAGDAIRAHDAYPAIATLIVLGALTKSAQFPFQFWLPHAMAAPTPVSAYLHSATMVKAGVFLLARLWPVLHGTDLWFWMVGGAGVCSLLFGGLAALFQRDMKGVLAYSTISHLGLITLLLGMNSSLALVAAVFHMMNHATFKASLFMAAGIVDHETGTRDLKRLSGLGHAMPVTATVALVAAAAMAGVPLLNGFLSKEMFFAATTHAGRDGWLVQVGLPAAATLAGMFSVAYSIRFIHQVFFGPLATDLPRAPHEPTRGMLLPSMLLVLACVLVGVLPGRTIGPFLHTAAGSILGADLPTYSLALWHGFNAPVLMSILALAGGLLIYGVLYRRSERATGRPPVRAPVDGRRAFDIVMVTIVRASDRLARVVASRRLQVQLLLIVLVAIAAAAVPLRGAGWQAGGAPTPLNPVFALLWVVGAACAVGAANQGKYHRLAALIMVGGAGLVTAITFAWFSAPDLALTQIAVEVVTTVLLLLGLRWMPRRLEDADLQRHSARARARRARDFVVALVAGLGLAGLAYAVLTRPPVAALGPYFLERALPEGGGRNVVNVILVDFRGFDTLGEITVVAVVALTVYALLRRFRPAPESRAALQAHREERARESLERSDGLPAGYLRLPATIARVLLPLAGLVSVYFLLRGHNAPGGGFVGGLVMATAIIVQYMTSGVLWVESRLRIHPQSWIAFGLLGAGGAGVAAWFAAEPFLTSLEWHPVLPLAGPLHLSTVLLFDLGVYMVVVGATVLMLVAIAHQSLRRPRRTLPPEATAPAVTEPA